MTLVGEKEKDVRAKGSGGNGGVGEESAISPISMSADELERRAF